MEIICSATSTPIGSSIFRSARIWPTCSVTSDAGVELCRQECQYFSVCGGGEPVNKLSENGTFVSSETTIAD